jgi:hypothetical protein
VWPLPVLGLVVLLGVTFILLYMMDGFSCHAQARFVSACCVGFCQKGPREGGIAHQ